MATKVRALVVPLLMLAVCAGQHQVSCTVRLSCQAGPTELLVNSSEQVILNCMPEAGLVHPINTTWMRNGMSLEPVEPHTHNLENGSLVLTVGEDSSSVEGLYSCRVAGPQGVIVSRSLFIRRTAAPSFLLHPEPQTIAVGAAARLHCSATGHPVPSIFWERDGNPIPTSDLRHRGGRQLQLCCCTQAAEDLGAGGSVEGCTIQISQLDKKPEQPEVHELEGLICCKDVEGQQTSADPSSLASEYTCQMDDARSCPAGKMGNGGFHDMHSRRVEGDDCANAVVNSTEASACEIWQTENSTMLTDFSFTSLQNLENDTELRSLQAPVV